MHRVRLLLLALSGMVLTANAPKANFHEPAYTVLPVFRIDLADGSLHTFKSNRLEWAPIEDCSTDEVFCIRSLCAPSALPSPPMPACAPGDELALLWPRACVRHFEVGETIEHAGMRAQVIGHYDRIIHHTGMRSRELVLLVEGQPDLALLVSGTRVRGFLIDTAERGQIMRRFERNRVFDSSNANDPDFPGLIITRVLPSGLSGPCTK